MQALTSSYVTLKVKVLQSFVSFCLHVGNAAVTIMKGAPLGLDCGGLMGEG